MKQIIFYLLLIPARCLAQTNVVPDLVEFNALKALWESTSGSNWANNTGWPSADNWPSAATAAQMANWFGVTVVNGDISQLLLKNNNLIGILPTDINKLTRLVKVDVSNNDLVSLSSLSSHINKVNLQLMIQSNRLDFSTLESYANGFKQGSVFVPQKNIKDEITKALTAGDQLQLLARPPGANTLISWQKLSPNGSWIPLTNDEDNVAETYTRNIAGQTDQGVYRWTSTSTRYPGITVSSEPIQIKTSVQFTLDNWCFQYKYDGRKRMTHKKIPGADWVYMVYDDRDRLVMKQDGNQRVINQWTFTRYDTLNRPIMNGLYTHTAPLDQEEMSDLVLKRRFCERVDSGSIFFKYTDTVMPSSIFNGTFEPLSITYYDNYDFLESDKYFSYRPGRITGQRASENNRVNGNVTGVWTRVLGDDKQWIRSVHYYDEKYRLIQTVADNHKRGLDILTNTYDFVGKLIGTKSESVDHHLSWDNAHASAWISEDRITCKAGPAIFPYAFSAQQLPSGINGWVEFTCSSETTQPSVCWFGFSARVSSDVDFSIRESITTHPANITVQAVESGVSKGPVLPARAGDVLRIERTEDSIYYKKNGTNFYKHKLSSRPAWYAHAKLNQPDAELFNPKISIDGEIRSTRRQYQYDHAGRLSKIQHSIDNEPAVVISKNEYNEVGQLVDKKLHSRDEVIFNQSIDYRYNIRGWLTSMNGAELSAASGKNKDMSKDGKDLFGIDLIYQSTDAAIGNAALYNGNISAMRWSSNLGLGTTKELAYNFSYDPMNRLNAAISRRYDGQWHSSGAFNEFDITYDLNGNIRTLKRTDEGGTMDQLAYDYSVSDSRTNMLRKVGDRGTSKGFTDVPGYDDDYTYDHNGNMTSDRNKGITLIAYNLLNLPERVTKSTGEYLVYTYDAAGRKLAQDVFAKTNVLLKRSDYRGEWYYENDTLRFVNHDEGRVVPEGEWVDAPQLLSDPGVTNPGNFGPAGTSNVTITRTIQNNGSYLRIVSNQSTSTPGFLSPFVKVVPGRRYTFRLKGYVPDNASVVLYVLGNGYESGDLLWPGPLLPKGQANEDWVEATFTAAATTNRVRVGATWNSGVTSGSMFYVSAMELYEYNGVRGNRVFSKSGNTYQYHLKDHLGNVRMTFTTKDERVSMVATVEAESIENERSDFLRYDMAKRVRSELFDHTNDRSNDKTGYAVRLNGSENERIGLARSLSVMPGDTMRAEVFAKYADPDSRNWTSGLTALMGYVALPASGPAGTVVDGRGYLMSGSTPLGISPGLPGDVDDGRPRAYLNCVFINRNYDLTSMRFAYDRISEGKETGADVPHDRLTITELITEPGYVYVYLSNDASGHEVYFDDFLVEHIQSPVIQMQDYYPFGMGFNCFLRENSVLNRLRFQGQEHIDDMGLNWDSFKWRNHQADIGRFFNIDPLADKYFHNSPYAFSENKVVAKVELEGLEAATPELLVQAVAPEKKVVAEYKKQDDRIIISPVQDPVINSEFGPREKPVPGASDPHPAVDIVRTNPAQTLGTDVVAPTNGKITAISSRSDGNGAGNRIHITANTDGKRHSFFHLQDGFGSGLSVGQDIKRGTPLGQVGATGNVSGPHLHYEIRNNGVALNPRTENPGLTNAPTDTEARSVRNTPQNSLIGGAPESNRMRPPSFVPSVYNLSLQ